MNLLNSLDEDIKEAIKSFRIDSNVILEYSTLKEDELKQRIKIRLVSGHITTISELRKVIRNMSIIKAGKKLADKKLKSVSVPRLPDQMAAQDLLKAINSNLSRKGIDKDTRQILNSIIQDSENSIKM